MCGATQRASSAPPSARFVEWGHLGHEARLGRSHGRRRTEGAVGMPQPIAQLEKPDAIVGRHDVAVAVQVGEIRDARAESMVLTLADVTGALVVLELAEVQRERDLL